MDIVIFLGLALVFFAVVFAVVGWMKNLADSLKDKEDHPKIIKRMEVLAKLYRDRELLVTEVDLDSAKGVFYKMFSSLVLADWAAYYTAKNYGVEPEQVPMVEEFKKLIA